MAKRNSGGSGAHMSKTPPRENKKTKDSRAVEKEARQQARRRAAAEKAAAKETARADKSSKKKRGRDASTGWQQALRTVKIVLICLLALVILAGAAAVYLGHRVSNDERNLPNVFLDGIGVGGLSTAETLARLNESGWDEAAATPLTVTLPMGLHFTLDRREAGVALTAETAAAAAYRYGHSESWFDNLLRYGENYLTPVDVALEYPSLNEDYVKTRVQEGLKAFQASVKAENEEAVIVDLENACLRTVKGAGEAVIDEKKLTAAVEDALLAGETALDYGHIDNTLTEPDFAALYEELNVEPEDAYFVDDGSFEVVDEVVGCTFDTDEASALWRAAGLMETVEIPLTITEPEVTGESLRSLLFRDLLGTQTTSMSGSSANRISNINLAVSKINGVILMPGEEFSYNGTVGQRTQEAGFLEAPAYADGEVVQELGGGICQVSSTLYCATLYANLQTVSRTNHYFRVSYLPIAYDATVSWTSPDFKFRNNRDYPVEIIAYTNAGDNTLTVEIFGTNVDGSYVELTNHQYTVYDTTYTDVAIGWGAQAVRHVYNADGSWREDIKEPYGVYNMHPEDIAWPPEASATAENEVVVVVGDEPLDWIPEEVEIPAVIVEG